MQKNCKECLQLKDSFEFYTHPKTKDGLSGRCRECIKRGRKSEREKIMSRIRDRDRYKHNSKRKEQLKKHSKKWRELNPEKRKAQVKVGNYLRTKNAIHPKECCICKSINRLHYHHEDYNFPNKVYSLCNICHTNRHAGNIELDISKEITLDFSNKRSKVFIKDNDGIIRTPKELSEIYGIKRYTITQRYRKGFTFNDIIFNGNLQHSNKQER